MWEQKLDVQAEEECKFYDTQNKIVIEYTFDCTRERRLDKKVMKQLNNAC